MDSNPSKAVSPQPAASPSKGAAFDPRDLVPEPIFCLDGEGRLIWVNHAAEKLTGYTAAQLVGQPFATLITTSKRRRLSSFFIRQLHVSEAAECERDVPLLKSDGRTAWVGARVRRVRTLNGKVGYVACAHDLHNMVFEIENLRREVRDLRVQADEATAAAELKGDFLATMTEEIHAPMDGLLSMTRLLLESNLDRDQRTFAEVVHGSSEALLTLVTDILDFNKIEAGALSMQAIDFDVRVTADGTAAMLSPAANAQGIELERQVHHDVPSHLNGDPGRLRQILTNVVRRLLHFLDEGRIQLWINLVEETAHEAVLRFSVSYTASNPGRELGDLVQVFGSSDVDRAKRLGGDALAFAISRKLVSLMGGTAGGEAQPSGGTVWFEIPFKRAEARAPMAPLPDVQLQGMRVLVAEPSVGMRTALTRMLSSWGCEADEAEDGNYALTLLQEAARQGRPYRVALIENQLPGRDGEDLAKAIRGDQTVAGTLLMLLTSVGRRGDAARAQDLGYSAYLVKPFEPSYLFDAMAEVVHRGTTGARNDIVTRHSVAEGRRQRMRILLVEDNSVNQLVAVAALRRAGFQPETASSAAEAVQAHSLQAFDIVFLDLELPDMDGFEALEHFQRMESGTGRKTPIVALTGDTATEMRERCLGSGFKECLAKPLDLDSMVQAVDKWVQPEGLLEPVAEPATEKPVTAPEAGTAARTAPEPAAPVAAVSPIPNRWAPEQDSDTGEPVLDEARLKASSMGNVELENILINTFIHHIRPRLQRLRDAATSGDAGAIEFEAHGIKGMCSTIGAMACADVFGRIERLGREKRLEPVNPMLDYADMEVSRVETLVAPRSKAA